MKIDANLLLINNINKPKLVYMYGCKLATNVQNFTEIHLASVKISQKVLGATIF